MLSFGNSRVAQSSRSIVVLWLATLLVACVGSEGSSSGAGRASDGSSPTNVASEAATSGWDSIAPLHYRLFERTPWPDDSSRTLVRFVVMRTAEDAESDVLAKTLMMALDSVAGTDTSLVAVRGILYTARPTEPGRANLVPTVWGEWVPPGGWDAEPPKGRRRAHRTLIYHMDPGWQLEPTSALEDESE
jgi:hypothetical protein